VPSPNLQGEGCIRYMIAYLLWDANAKQWLCRTHCA
jgi:hypothetical protein